MPNGSFVNLETLAAPSANAMATGPFGSSIGTKTFRESGVPVIRGSNLSAEVGTRLIDNGLIFIDPELARQFHRSAAKEGDLVFTCWGTVNQVGLIDKRSRYSSYIVSNKQMKFTADAEKVIPLYLYYWFSGPIGQADILSGSIGSSVPGFNLGQLRKMKVPLPSMAEQRSIVSILEALDDKIELNRRMNETLEGMGRAIYKDWFVDFGPTRAKVEGRSPYLASEIWALFPGRRDDEGKPEGWRSSTVGAEFRLTMGQSPPGETYNEVEAGLPFFQGRSDFGARYPKRRMFCSAPTRVAELDDTLVSVRAPVGDLNMAWERCCIGRGVASVRHRSGHRGYTYYTMSHLQPDLAAFEHTGTVFGAINKAQFEVLKIAAPDRRVVDAFEEFVSHLDERIRLNEMESATVVATRDLLLPKLMSGEIRVKDADKVAEAGL